MKVCPHCGEILPPKAIHCKACGSDAHTGWSDAYYSEDLEPDYEEILENEFGDPKKKAGVGKIATAVIAGALIALFVLVR
ncbi:MAG: zinc ribbon domain-containing protein [Fibrobacter sp.]|jgi:uncharacterized membrane protein YvbJ|nr:zinc ribbon domain-containing protein [Fibrobacter sp.]